MSAHKYKDFNQMKYWESLPMIPRDHQFKTIPLDILDGMGWRWVAEKIATTYPISICLKEYTV